MAVFKRPADAFHAIAEAQMALAQPGSTAQRLELKAGLHFGPCIAVNLNDRLDYFGTTVNLASRLVDMSSGQDLVLSDEFHDDPEVSVLLEDDELGARVEPHVTTSLKGFEDEAIRVWRVGIPR
ncbi:MAG: adenylate/guanylate cyclase domain-containing protein [Chloroflexi bacterium]|nr:adenylate/guanylate cyclase domain-containing protein [Chloroflexota bacterium]